MSGLGVTYEDLRRADEITHHRLLFDDGFEIRLREDNSIAHEMDASEIAVFLSLRDLTTDIKNERKSTF